jgi:TPR repeat protein/Leucine-rich repeat (LRR) protein
MTAPHRVGKYDVFISHCGIDCKKDFADWLREDLKGAGVLCFLDEPSLEVGKVAAEEMLRDMEEATYGVVILSPGFFEREWCMKELETFARRGRVVPVFLGSFAAIQAAAEAAVAKGVWKGFECFKWDEEEYRRVVREATKFVGVKLAEEGWWRTCIRRVRDEVLRLLGKLGGGIRISEDELLVGQEEHLKELKRLLGLPQDEVSASSEFQTSQVVGIVGVKGMGGVGKTTMALRLYDDPDVRQCFKGGICWLEVGPKPSNDKIRDLQKQILKQLCDVDEDPGNPTRGRELIRQRLNGKRVLICLDDVWEPASIATAVVNISDLAAGSRILKTSRVRESIRGHIHDLDSLEPGSAWELFCWHAFGGQKPPDVLAGSAEGAALRCAGLPLALRVLGRQVAEAEAKRECLQTFLDLPRENDAMIDCRSIIKTSYDNLPFEPRGLGDAFLLVAGVWPRMPEFMLHQQAVENLGAAIFGASPRSVRFELARTALKKLYNLSLVGLNEDCDVGRLSLTVHDLIVDVAETLADDEEGGFRKFLRQPVGDKRLRLPLDPSRLEHLSLHSGSISIRGVKAACSLVLGPGAELIGRIPDDDGPSLCRLFVMQKVQSVQFHIFSDLQCLRLRRCSFDLFPDGIENLSDLCILEITNCWALRSLPESIGALTGLTSLGLSGCSALQSLPESIGQLTGLTSLSVGGSEELPELEGTGELQSLPESIKHLTVLASLKLSRCSALQRLSLSFGCLIGLTSLDLSRCEALGSLPESIGAMTTLANLDLHGCKGLRSLPESIGSMTKLTRLNLSWCGALEGLPESVGALTGLKSLALSGCRTLAWLPESIGALTGLTSLDLHTCPNVQGASLYWWAAARGNARAQCCMGLCYEQGTGVKMDEAKAAELYAKAAEQGDATGQCWLGVCYELGRGVEKDDARAAELYGKAADQGLATAQCCMGECYELGGGVEKDEANAAELYAKAAEQGDAWAQCRMGLCYELGRGVEKDEARAAELYAKASEQGDAKGHWRLGECYYFGTGVEKDEARAAGLYAKAAAQGHAKGQWRLGECYYFGTGVERDEARAAELYGKATDQGLATAQCYLGVCYENGTGVEKDETRAAELYAKAAEQGLATAQCYLGLCYANGKGVEKDEERAAELYAKAAEQGDATAQCNLGLCYANGKGVEKDEERAAELYAKAAAKGHAKGQWRLGECYYFGTGVEKDEARAAGLYAKAAAQGHAKGQWRLGECYYFGTGVERDEARAAELYAKAAERGDSTGQYYLGVCYENSTGAEKDEARAAGLYAKAAAQGHAKGQWRLGECYYFGTGVEKDEARAAELYAKAAEQGDATAQCNLGLCYANGTGVGKDEARTAELYRKAAEQGDARGQCNLGLCYARGRGVEKDGGMAVKWMRRAAEQGDPAMEANLAELFMEGLGGAPDWVEALQLFQSSLNIYAPSKVTSAWMLWVGQSGVELDRLKAKTMCEEVLTTEDLEIQLGNREALGWTWPAALEWFRGEAWREEESSGEAVESVGGERGLHQEADENGGGSLHPRPVHFGKGALAEPSGRAENAGESHENPAAVLSNTAHSGEALGPRRRPTFVILHHISTTAGIVAIALGVVAIAIAVSETRRRSLRL